MFRLGQCIVLAAVTHFGLTAGSASAQPIRYAPAPSAVEVQPGSASLWGNSGGTNGGQFGNDYRPVAPPVPDISGVYLIAGRPCLVRQWGGRLLFINEWGGVSAGVFLSPTAVQALDWDYGLIGILNRNRIEWANGTVWFKR